MLNLVLNSTYFSFNNINYHQMNGSPVGTPLSPFLVEIVKRDLDNTCLSLLDSKPLRFFRYVDDIFCIVPRTSI